MRWASMVFGLGLLAVWATGVGEPLPARAGDAGASRASAAEPRLHATALSLQALSIPRLALERNNVFPVQQILPASPTHGEHKHTGVLGDKYFARATIEGATGSFASPTFKIEGIHDEGSYQICSSISRGAHVYNASRCEDIRIGIVSSTGLMYLYYNERSVASVAKYRSAIPMGGFSDHIVEVSATDDSDNRRIFRESVVSRSERTPDCSDYPNLDSKRFKCLFLYELLPETPPATTTALTNALPDELTQAKSNYKLVFAEEFDGTPEGDTTDTCRNGMVLIDPDHFTYRDDPCSRVDANGKQCENVVDGVYLLGRSRTCSGVLSTKGKIAYRYGYFEFKYTLNIAENPTNMNAATVIGDPRSPGRLLLPRYGITLRNYEDITTYLPQEIDVTEYNPRDRMEYSHRNLNNPPVVVSTAYSPRDSNRRTKFCSTFSRPRLDEVYFLDLSPDEDSTGCEVGDKFTVTKGIEWTPSGYRYFMKVDGASAYTTCTQVVGTLPGDTRCTSAELTDTAIALNELFLLRSNRMSVYYRNVRIVAGNAQFTRAEWVGAERDLLFRNHSDGIYLERHGINHVPLDFGNAFWLIDRIGPRTIQVQMEMDYYRIFQPTNLYSDMEPGFT